LFRQTNRFTPLCLGTQTGLHHLFTQTDWFTPFRLHSTIFRLIQTSQLWIPSDTKCSPTKSLGYSRQATRPAASYQYSCPFNHLLRCTPRRMKTNTKTAFVRFLSTAKRLTTLRRTPPCIFKLRRRPIKVYSCPCPLHKDLWRRRNIAPFILNLDISWRRAVSFMLRPP